MKIILASVLMAVAIGCSPDPKACFEKGDAKACQALCDTGKQELMSACYEVRARGAEACADGTGDCTEACTNWNNAQAMDSIKAHYVAKLGSDAKVKALTAKCGK